MERPAEEALRWHLERGLGHGLALLRTAPRPVARAVVAHVCLHETRWDPALEDRGHYLLKALGIVGDPSLEEALLDQWERQIPWRYRGPWADVGFLLAALGHERAQRLLLAESSALESEEGPGAPAWPAGTEDPAVLAEAIREDPRLSVGGGLRLGELSRRRGRAALRKAMRDEGHPHLQQAAAIALSRVADEEGRAWLLGRLTAARKPEEAFFWWQGLSGQDPCPEAAALARAAVDEEAAYSLPWVLRVLDRNYDPAQDAGRLAAGVRRGLREAAEDAVSVGLEILGRRWQPGFHELLLEVVRTSAFGRNRDMALTLALRARVPVPVSDLLALLEDAELSCRLQALARVPLEAARPLLETLVNDPREDPGFRRAARQRLQAEAA